MARGAGAVLAVGLGVGCNVVLGIKDLSGSGLGGGTSSSTGGGTSSSTGGGTSSASSSSSSTTSGTTSSTSSCAGTTSDPHNCGACGVVCESGQCADSLCTAVLVAAVGDSPAALALDDQSVYFTVPGSSANSGTVYSVPLAGSPNAAMIATGQNNPRGITAWKGTVFWTEEAPGGRVQYFVTSTKAGGTIGTYGSPVGMATNGTYVYWTAYGDGTISRADVDGSNPKTLVNVGLTTPLLLALSSQELWVISPNGQDIEYAPLVGGTGMSLHAGEKSPTGVGATDQFVYFTDSFLRGVYQVPVGSTTATQLAPAMMPTAMAVDGDTDVYFADSAQKTVAKVSVTTRKVTVISENHPNVVAIALNATTVYWATGNGIFRLPR